MNNINKTTIEKIKQATSFLDEKYQKPLQLATIYVESQILAEIIKTQDNTAKINTILQILSPSIDKDKIALVQMLLNIGEGGI